MLRYHPIEQRQILACDAARPFVDGIALPDREGGEPLAERGVRHGEVTAGVRKQLTTRAVALDNPAGAQAAQAERLGKIAEQRGVRKPRGRSQRWAMVDRMVALVGNEAHVALETQIV